MREALDSVRPYMESHGGDVELLGIDDGVARLRLDGRCNGCPASAATLELAIKEALDEAAPDLPGSRSRASCRAQPPGPSPGCCRSRCPTAAARADADVGGARRGRRRRARRAAHGHRCAAPSWWSPTSTGTLLAYRNALRRAAAPASATRRSSGEILTCARCGRGFDLPRAGRALGADGGQLEPVPLLRAGGHGREGGAGAA